MIASSSGWLERLERAGNRLPHPTLLFVWLCLLRLPLSALLAGLCGAVYGRVSGRFRSAGGIIEAMETTMRSMSGYLVLMFFAAQFVAWFSYLKAVASYKFQVEARRGPCRRQGRARVCNFQLAGPPLAARPACSL